MIASSSFTSCNFPFLRTTKHSCSKRITPLSSFSIKPYDFRTAFKFTGLSDKYQKKKGTSIQNAFFVKTSQDPVVDTMKEDGGRSSGGTGGDGGGGGGGGGDERDWTSSFLLFAFWAGIMYYVFFLTPNQTPSLDFYFLQKLLNLKGGDGFQMNEVIVALWYIMGLWPLVYSMLLLPTGRSSSNSKIPVWPFLILSCFGGAYALIPYFVLWRPPAPPIEETELTRWPLNFLESKVTAAVTMAAGLAILTYAGLPGIDAWKEYLQYFNGSKFIHLTSIDFSLLSAFAPFWVYNDMTARKWEKGYWLLPLSLIPFLGPSLYLLLRPSLSAASVSQGPTVFDDK